VRPYEVIHRKRDGRPVPPEAIAELVTRYAEGAVPDYQMAAFCMAVFFRGMSEAELQALTGAMLHSGDVLDLSGIPGPKVDKHSTGGVGDKTSLAVAPLAAACGVKVPMVSGRGLGHTGGTLDKLESIPGFQIQLPVKRFREVLASVGACLIGQTDRIAPADRKLYALRDLTATVESIPLIAASILSKKLAEGIDGLVLDVKVGSGAFMKRLPEARLLARTLCALGRGMGKRVTALVTDMDQPLGRAVGNALEVKEILDLLHGVGPADLRELTVVLTAEMLLLGGVAATEAEARGRVEQAISDGRGFRKLCEIVEAQEGDSRALSDPARLPRAAATLDVGAPAAGLVEAIDAEALGLAAMALGAGRSRIEDRVDPGAGLEVWKKVGDPVDVGESLVTLHVGKAPLESPETVAARVRGAYRIGAGPATAGPLVLERIEEGA
jgi:pyrimidine-nucleoside phosphorylase/thymidine phosphorylase